MDSMKEVMKDNNIHEFSCQVYELSRGWVQFTYPPPLLSLIDNKLLPNALTITIQEVMPSEPMPSKTKEYFNLFAKP